MDEVTTPITSPKVRFGGKEYELRFRLSDVLNLWKDHQIDITKRVEGVEAFARVPVMLAAGIHAKDAPTAEQIADEIELGEMPIYLEALVAAQKKASPAALQASERIKQAAAEPAAMTNGLPQPPA